MCAKMGRLRKAKLGGEKMSIKEWGEKCPSINSRQVTSTRGEKGSGTFEEFCSIVGRFTGPLQTKTFDNQSRPQEGKK